MYIKKINLFNFRNYKEVDLDFCQGINVLFGLNGMGKTNIIEGLHYVSHLTSHRVSKDINLIKTNHDKALIRVEVLNKSKHACIELELNANKQNRARLNNGKFVRPRSIVGLTSTVLFAPEHMPLLKNEPSLRRKFMDEMLISIAPRFLGVCQDYEKALKQRNILIKNAKKARMHGKNINHEDFFIWNEYAAKYASILINARVNMLKNLQPYFHENHSNITNNKKAVYFKYSSLINNLMVLDLSVEEIYENLIKLMNRNFLTEIDRGQALIGPHRDDMIIFLDELPAKGYVSQGEAWSIILSLKLACHSLLREKKEEPILILDDVLSELDLKRRQYLSKSIANIEQVIITSAIESDISKNISIKNKIHISNGSVIKH